MTKRKTQPKTVERAASRSSMNAPDLSSVAACLQIAHRHGVELARLLLAGSVQAEREHHEAVQREHGNTTQDEGQ